MTQPKIVIAEQDLIDAHEATARRFFSELFGMDLSGILITDESRLTDFSTCCADEAMDFPGNSLSEIYDAWDAWVIPEIERRYAVRIDSTAITLVAPFSMIEQQQSVHIH